MGVQGKPPKMTKPVFSFEHSAEGFALDWSRVAKLRCVVKGLLCIFGRR